MRLIEKPTVELRGEMAVIIFPSRPYWFSATREVTDLIEILGVEISKEEAIEKIIERIDVDRREAEETLDELVDLFYSSGVLLIEGKLSPEAEVIEPHFQVNSVENVLVIAATQGCNLNCPHCYAVAKQPLRDEMNTAEMKQLIDDLASMSWKNEVSRVGLSGGEFFTRSDALDIIDYVHNKGFKTIVSSNALLLTKKDIARLAMYPDFKISVSLDGPTAKIHEIIRGEGTFSPTVETIKEMTSMNIFVGINMFIHQDNVEFIKGTLHLANVLGVKAFNCLNMMRVGRANSRRSQRKLERISEQRLNRILFDILHGNSRYQEMMKNSTFANQVMGIAGGVKSKYCGIGTNRALYVRANGDIYPCPDTAIAKFCLGNIRTQKLADIWEQSPILGELRKLSVDEMNEKCAQCDVRYFCGGGCRGENYQVNKKLRSPHFNCKEIRKTIIDMMWMLTEEPTFFQYKVADLYQKVCV